MIKINRNIEDTLRNNTHNVLIIYVLNHSLVLNINYQDYTVKNH